MSEKIVLIDGHSILNRAFYGLPDLTNSEGKHTNAVYGFLNIMFKILEEEKPQYLTVAFDLSAPTFRHKMYEAYKGTRKPAPGEFREQVPVIKEVLRAMGVNLMEMEGYEADDLLGTIARAAEAKGFDVSLVSGDRDLLQLATEKILIRIPKTRGGQTTIEDYHTQDVIDKYQLKPLQIIDLKALMGDASDNIPGIPGVGEKTATKILLEYENIENAHEHVADIKPNKAKLSLEEHYDMAVMSKELATIDTNAPVEFSWEKSQLGDLYTQEAFDMFRKLEFKNLLKRFEHVDASTNVEEKFETVQDLSQVELVFDQAGKAPTMGMQLLTDQEDVLAVSIAYEEHAFFIPAEGFVTGEYLLDQIAQLIEKVPMICAMDVKSMLRFLPGAVQERFFDVGVAAYLMNPLKSTYPYEDVAKEYLDLMVPSRTELLGKKTWAQAMNDAPEAVSQCACYMAYVALMAKTALEEAMESTDMAHLFHDVEMPLLFALYDMEREGILVDAGELKTYGDKLYVRIQELEKLIYEQAGETFNINSPKQLGVILFEKMQMPGGKKTKTGYSTAADILEKLAPDHAIIKDILEYRQLTKLKSTYADGLANFIEADGRIHSNFNQTITATGRISSNEPNLQNIPMRMELGRLIRKCFIPKDGFIFVDADYSQIELRVLAHMSGDEMLIQAYQEARDIHRITASQVFHIPFDEVTDLQRRNAKAVNFGIVYGISSFGLSQDLSISPKEAAKYIKDYFATYPKIKEFLDGLVAEGKEKGYVTTMFGRRRPIPELSSSNFMQRAFGERVAMNSPIQGTAADIIKIAMVRVDKRLKEEGLESRLILQVHDELLIEAKKEEVDRVGVILEEEMKGAAQLAVELEIDMHSGTDWYEAK
ncbi:MAG: DNA polymerase I [Lachnospiraceae bacterium]|nr:DNA polymerase I [Lachnospiraceae bacterium]